MRRFWTRRASEEAKECPTMISDPGCSAFQVHAELSLQIEPQSNSSRKLLRENALSLAEPVSSRAVPAELCA